MAFILVWACTPMSLKKEQPEGVGSTGKAEIKATPQSQEIPETPENPESPEKPENLETPDIPEAPEPANTNKGDA